MLVLVLGTAGQHVPPRPFSSMVALVHLVAEPSAPCDAVSRLLWSGVTNPPCSKDNPLTSIYCGRNFANAEVAPICECLTGIARDASRRGHGRVAAHAQQDRFGIVDSLLKLAHFPDVVSATPNC